MPIWRITVELVMVVVIAAVPDVVVVVISLMVEAIDTDDIHLIESAAGVNHATDVEGYDGQHPHAPAARRHVSPI